MGLILLFLSFPPRGLSTVPTTAWPVRHVVGDMGAGKRDQIERERKAVVGTVERE
jgi:hypothetical protein